MKYYLYQIRNKNTGMIYIGVHCSKKIRDRYMGSGTRIREAIKKEGIENFEKTILEFFENKEEMLQREKEVVNKEFIKRSDTYNIIIGGGFNTVDNIVVKDSDGNKFMVNKDDPRYLSGELISMHKGKIGNENQKIAAAKIFKKLHENGLIKYDTFKNKKHSEESKEKMRNSQSGKQAGSKNSQFGKVWITNGIENKKICRGSKIPKGYKLGRKIKMGKVA